MNVLYIFSTPNASYLLDKMIIPQLEAGSHPAQVVGMFFFVDNNYLLTRGNPTAAKLSALAKEGKVGFLMGCDQCCYQRNIAEMLEPPATIGCFPNLYAAAQQRGVQQVITL
ncbi:MAG: sulfur reduction protein DsrE [Thiobacillaceae bacterium]|nr:sulfur reduction protein DsrE [Thiobacillaceae bacterium]MCX7673150.1 sulfur reduction protein DsrE [Thiobacillaceae bacterium]MDW8322893.1 hypothetical protein [Burkholderiales bacterium]